MLRCGVAFSHCQAVRHGRRARGKTLLTFFDATLHSVAGDMWHGAPSGDVRGVNERSGNRRRGATAVRTLPGAGSYLDLLVLLRPIACGKGRSRGEVADAKLPAQQLSHVCDLVGLHVHNPVAVAFQIVVPEFAADEAVDRGLQRLLVVPAEHLEECAVEWAAGGRLLQNGDQQAGTRSHTGGVLLTVPVA